MIIYIQKDNSEMPLFDACQVIYEQCCFHNIPFKFFKAYDINFINMSREDIIVGSVEMTRNFILNKIDKNFKFIDTYPQDLDSFYGRGINRIKLKDYKEGNFIKPVENKIFDGGIRSINEICLETGISKEEFNSSEIECYSCKKINKILVEYRCFVYNKELVGIQYYSGDFKQRISLGFIKKAVDSFKSQPIAYCIDVALINDNGWLKHIVVEVNDLLSSGTYGFSYKLLDMYISRFKEIRN